jgi:alcohol dehydrogenase YqhD (iron-dependent ADH family)
MRDFIYHIPTKVYFGNAQLSHLGDELKKYGSKVLLCYGGGSIKKSGLYERVTELLRTAGLSWFELSGIEPNPRVTSVQRGAEICKREKINVLLAVGGGSVIDCAKLVAAAAFYEGDAWDIVTRAYHPVKALPIVGVSTVSGTGSDMDPTGVITNAETAEKKVFSFPELLRPKVSFLIPSLTYSVSPYQTACGSADILSHAIESYFVPADGSMYLLDTFKEGLMRTVIRYAPIAMDRPDNEEARANLQWAASWAINGFTGAMQNVSWTCHPIEHELSAFYDITHGLGLAIITPKWMRYILNDTTADRFYGYGVNVFGIDASRPRIEVAKESIVRTEEFLYRTMKLEDNLSALGIGREKFEVMAQRACFAHGTLPGYQPLKPKDVIAILEMAQ